MVAALTGACSSGAFFGGAGASGQAKKAASTGSADARQSSNIEKLQNMPAIDYFEQVNTIMRDFVGDEEYDVDGIAVSNMATDYEKIMNKALDLGLEGLTVKDIMGEYTGKPSEDEFFVAVEEVFGEHAEIEADTFGSSSDSAMRLLVCGASSSAISTGGTVTDSDFQSCGEPSGGGGGQPFGSYYRMSQESGRTFQNTAINQNASGLQVAKPGQPNVYGYAIDPQQLEQMVAEPGTYSTAQTSALFSAAKNQYIENLYWYGPIYAEKARKYETYIE